MGDGVVEEEVTGRVVVVRGAGVEEGVIVVKNAGRVVEVVVVVVVVDVGVGVVVGRRTAETGSGARGF